MILLLEVAQLDVDANGESKQIISPTENIFLVGKLFVDLPTANLIKSLSYLTPKEFFNEMANIFDVSLGKLI